MLIDSPFAFIRKRDHLIQEGEVAAFREIFVHGREEPQGVVRPVSGVARLTHIFGILRAGFVSGIMLYVGHTEAEASQIAALIMSGASVIAYCVGEGLADQKGGTE